MKKFLFLSLLFSLLLTKTQAQYSQKWISILEEEYKTLFAQRTVNSDWTILFESYTERSQEALATIENERLLFDIFEHANQLDGWSFLEADLVGKTLQYEERQQYLDYTSPYFFVQSATINRLGEIGTVQSAYLLAELYFLYNFSADQLAELQGAMVNCGNHFIVATKGMPKDEFLETVIQEIKKAV